jgi:hypothetical protein
MYWNGCRKIITGFFMLFIKLETWGEPSNSILDPTLECFAWIWTGGLSFCFGVDSYGTGFGHFAIATEDSYKLVEDIRAKGGNVTRE